MRPKRSTRYFGTEHGRVPSFDLPLRMSLNLQLRVAEKARALGVTTNEYLLACVKRDLEGTGR